MPVADHPIVHEYATVTAPNGTTFDLPIVIYTVPAGYVSRVLTIRYVVHWDIADPAVRAAFVSAYDQSGLTLGDFVALDVERAGATPEFGTQRVSYGIDVANVDFVALQRVGFFDVDTAQIASMPNLWLEEGSYVQLNEHGLPGVGDTFEQIVAVVENRPAEGASTDSIPLLTHLAIEWT